MLTIRFALISFLSISISTQALFEDYRSIVENSASALDTIFATEKTFDDELEKLGIKNEVDLQQLAVRYNHLVQEFEQKNPLFFMHECTKQGDLQVCPLSRKFTAKYRNGFEDQVVKLLLHKASSHNPIQYLSFASGGLFQDLVILLKFLAQKPDAKMTIHFVDPQYTRYVECCNQLKKGQIISGDTIKDFLSVMDALVQYAHDHWDCGDLNNEEIAKNLTIYLLSQEAVFRQLITYVQRLFPRACLTMTLHPHAEGYFNYVEAHQIPYPDILISADIEDGNSQSQNAPQHFVLLCKKALEEKPDSCNVLLSRMDGYFEPVAYTKDDVPVNMSKLLTFSLEPISTQYFDVNGTPIYVIAEAIQPYSWWSYIEECFQRLLYKQLGLIQSTYI